MINFKPCPFCGGRVSRQTKKANFDEMVKNTGRYCVRVSCVECDVDMWGFGSDYHKAYEALAEKWNRRVTDDASENQ